MDDFVILVNEMAFDETRPRYILVLGNSDDWRKIENGILLPNSISYTIKFIKISDCISYTFCGANSQVIMDNIDKVLGHDNFFLAEINPYIKFENFQSH